MLLSRAQHGMYLIGNADTYLNVDMWADVHANLSQAGTVGNAIPLSCPRHLETLILYTEPDDFVRKSPRGGLRTPVRRTARAMRASVPREVPLPGHA